MKKLGRITGFDHSITGDRAGRGNKQGTELGMLRISVKHALRLTYSEILANEWAQCAVPFTRRALA